MAVIDLTGQKFGRLTVVQRGNDFVSKGGQRSVAWICRCDCGNVITVRSQTLRNGTAQSCGCLRKEMLSQRGLIDITGKHYGNLTVIRRAEDHIQPSGCKKVQWLCKCDCGKEVIVSSDNLKSGRQISCGCERYKIISRQKGLRNSRLYNIWHGMNNRCYLKKHTNYKNYGGRGISVCDEWRNSFLTFYEWAINNGYADDLSIDRIDVNGNYEPANCRWISNKEQQRNKTTNKYIEYSGENLTVSEWSERTGIPQETIHGRLNRGWSVEDALMKKGTGGSEGEILQHTEAVRPGNISEERRKRDSDKL